MGGCRTSGSARADTVIFASGADLQGINPLLTVHPLARQVQRYVLLTTLVQYDSAGVVVPYLARRWDWSSDRRTLTFHLARGLKWHDGLPTDAGDVGWTLNAARNPASGYPRVNDLVAITAVEEVDDSTVRLQFSRPAQGIPDVLTDLAILPRHLLDTVPSSGLRRAEWNRNPVGNGPFRFVSHEPNRRWVFEANPEFPSQLGGPPATHRLVIAVVDEPMTKLAALSSGELDFAGINPAHAEFVRRNPRLAVIDYPLFFTYAIVLNTRVPPFNDLALRRQMSQSVDRQEVVDAYLFGFGTAVDGAGAAGGAGEAGAGGGAPSAGPTTPPPSAPFELLTVGSGEAALEQLLQAQLARHGLEARIRQLELSAFLNRVQNPNPEFQAAVMGIPGDKGLGQLASMLRMSGQPVPSDTADQLRILADSAPVVFLYQARGVQGMNRRVQGVRMDVRGELATVARWRIDNQ